MSVNVVKDGRLLQIAGNAKDDVNSFTGTAKQVEEAIEKGEIREGMIVNITDDYEENPKPPEMPSIPIDPAEQLDASEGDFSLANINGEASKISFENILGKIALSALTTAEKTMVGAVNEISAKIEELKTDAGGGGGYATYEGTYCTVYVFNVFIRIEIFTDAIMIGNGATRTGWLGELPPNMAFNQINAMGYQAIVIEKNSKNVGTAFAHSSGTGRTMYYMTADVFSDCNARGTVFVPRAFVDVE